MSLRQQYNIVISVCYLQYLLEMFLQSIQIKEELYMLPKQNTLKNCNSSSLSLNNKQERMRTTESINRLKKSSFRIQAKKQHSKTKTINKENDTSNSEVEFRSTTHQTNNQNKFLPTNKKLQITPSYNKVLETQAKSDGKRVKLASINSQSIWFCAGSALDTQISQIIIDKILPSILENKIMNQNSAKHCILSRQNFIHLIKNIIISLSFGKGKLRQMIFLEQALKTIRDWATQTKKAQKSTRLNQLHSISLKINPQQQFYQHQNALLQLNLRRAELTEECSKLQAEKKDVSSFLRQNVRNIEDTNKLIAQNVLKIEELSRAKELAAQRVEQISLRLSALSAEAESVLCFVETQQKNRVLHLVAERYKEIEGEIYDFAAYLQGNQLASSLAYEPLPVRYWSTFIENLDAELRTLNRALLQSTEVPLQDKLRSVRDFVVKMHNALERKNAELQQSVDFKTRSITKFISMMKKWLQNWELKQEYLVGLRKQFAADCLDFEKTLQCILIAQKCPQIVRLQCTQLNVIYGKLKENYQLGNSFY